MKNDLMTVAETAARITEGAILLIAGSEEALRKLPLGKWIGGTSVYFVTRDGGRMDREHLFVTEVVSAIDARIIHRMPDDLPQLTQGRFDNGMSLILIPAFSQAHQVFAIDGACYQGLFDQPLMGWVTGIHLDDLGKVTPKVFDGATGSVHEEGAILMHVALPVGKAGSLDIVNLFTQDPDGDEISFAADGFSATTATICGKEVNLAAYLLENGIDTQLPLVADYAGAMINVSVRAIDAAAGRVDFYAPVIAGVSYRIARSFGDYDKVFAARAGSDEGENALSCNCILNYLYCGLEGKTTGTYTGPATFGEIAYILLNQTMVKLDIAEIDALRAA